MASLFSLSIRVLVICLTLSMCRAYGRQGALRSTPAVSIPSREACIPSQVMWGTRGDVESAPVSVASMLIPQKARRAFEHAERAFAGNKLEDAEKELNGALVIDSKSAVALEGSS